ncbi:hypothetical protein TWF132_006648 [Orbilia oligospora]|nr:hypothetical protein TWF132_006648 [Orbilia oligospora]
MQWQRCRPPEPLEGTATVEFYLPRETDLEYRRADDDRWKKRISFGPGALHVLHVFFYLSCLISGFSTGIRGFQLESG